MSVAKILDIDEKEAIKSLNDFSELGAVLNAKAKRKTAFWFMMITDIIRRR